MPAARIGPAFITLNTNSTLKGVVLYYPKQKRDDVPSPYPYAIAMRGKNPAVLDVELLNPYSGIDASHNERHLVRNVQGQPLRRGVFVDAIYDIGRIENVHFNPWWSNAPKLMAWQMANGEAFILARSDWQYMLNTFCFGYNVGYKFIKSRTGECNGNFLGLGADDCWRAVVVEQSAPFGLLITNGEFVSFHGPDPTMVEVAKGHTGSVRFVNCAFLGTVPADRQSRRAGDCRVSAIARFVQWDSKSRGRHAIQVESGTVLVRGCEFRAYRTAGPAWRRRGPGSDYRQRLRRPGTDRQRQQGQRADCQQCRPPSPGRKKGQGGQVGPSCREGQLCLKLLRNLVSWSAHIGPFRQ